MEKKDKENLDNEISEQNTEALPEPTAEEKLSDELKDTKDRYLRLAAEFENYKKSSAKERINSIKFANEQLILSLLPTLDNLEQAVAAGQKLDQEGAKNLLVGVSMVLKQLTETLEKFGVEFYSARGQTFDPTRHEAVSEEVRDDMPAGMVVTEFQRGYFLNGRLLRAARVSVSKKKTE
jgi:molecular chaperone GrpE